MTWLQYYLTILIINRGLLSQHPTTSLPVQVKPNIRRFQGSSVEFDDGSVVEDVDLVAGLIIKSAYSLTHTAQHCSWPVDCDWDEPPVLQLFATGYRFYFWPHMWSQRQLNPCRPGPVMSPNPGDRSGGFWFCQLLLRDWLPTLNMNKLPAFQQDPTALLDKIKVQMFAQWCAINIQFISDLFMSHITHGWLACLLWCLLLLCWNSVVFQ